MRVTIVSGAGYVSGKEIMSLELASGLREVGYSVDLVCSLWGDGEFARKAQELDIPTYRMRLGYISATPRLNELRMTADQLAHLPSLYWSYTRFLRNVAPEKIIHTNWHHLVLLLPFLRPNRDLFWVHEMIPNKSQYRKLFAILSRKLSCFVAVSRAVRESIIVLGVSPDLVKVVYNGLSDFTVRTELKNKDNSKVRIGIVGQIGPWKGHEDLFRAFALLLSRHSTSSELHIFGANVGPYADYLRNLAHELNLNGKLVWHGFKSDHAEIYSKIDICVVPSRFEEPFGLTAVEAAMAGLPCVATRRGGLSEIVEDGTTGILVESENPNQLSQALERLVADPSLRAKMGEAARRRALKHFSRARLIEEFAALLEKC